MCKILDVQCIQGVNDGMYVSCTNIPILLAELF